MPMEHAEHAAHVENAAHAEFSVLLGADFAGKSSVMAELAATVPTWRLLSTDGKFTETAFPLVAQLRRNVVSDVLPDLGTTYSADFLAALLQTAVVHLRDRIRASEPGAPIVVDSYYYKILAKCRLAGVEENPMFTWWRSFPRPRRIVYLDVTHETAWRRSGQGTRLNRLEHSGALPHEHAFESYQRDLRKVMLEETRDVPMTVIEECGDVARTAAAVREALADDFH
ncbi:hypothetical protein [Streptomyces inhibens]|uniref:hypothetical protein n=1 Tax=Streptomyces inhibens TaxID=2293571 RepID=UPI001EE74343|nr:hypothetical protein [Streptomyces inhibens]UKY53216.1 hypothetical protein KI385_33390 [Streptomyces inhibens]